MTGRPSVPTGSHLTAGEITLRDLLAWEPRLRVTGQAAGQGDSALDREVDWVVTARASDPALPTLRGGELILLPRRVFAGMGRPLPLLLNELAGQPVAGVAVDVEPPATAALPALPVLAVDTIDPEFESELNRLLTLRRGDLLRASAELERIIAEVSASETPLAELVALLATRLDLPLAILTPTGATLIAGGDTAPAPIDGDVGNVEERALGGDRTLRLGPLPAANRALARHLAPRLADVLGGAVARGLATRPVGPARAALLNRLLLATGEGTDERIAFDAVRAGLPVDGRFRVALAPTSAPTAPVARLLGRAGDTYDAGTVDGHAATVLVETIGLSETRAPEPVLREWLALSAPVATPAALPEATRQARYLAALLSTGQLRQDSGLRTQDPVVRFDDDARLGAYRLLYPLWDSVVLGQYVERLLGPLLREDRRGLLQQTLRAYLETGGSPGATAERLGIHRNTLAYRLRQLRQHPTIEPDDPAARLGLHLALLAAALPKAPAAQSSGLRIQD